MEEYKYLAIVDWSKDYIRSGQLKPNDRFLSEKELCSIHGVSRQTVRQALKCLENENVIYRVRGSGTFVKSGTAKPAVQNRCVGVISTYFSDYIFPSIVTGIESVLNENGIAMQLAITHNQVSEEAQALRTMIANGVQGLIVEPSKSALPNPNMELYQEIKKNNIPLVYFNAKYPWADFPYAAMNDEAAGQTVTDHLFECGHRRISGIFALDDIQGHKRYCGYMKSCLAHGVRTAENSVLWFATAEKSAIFQYAETKLLELIRGSTAIVCYNDKLAVNLLRFCREHDIAVPEDLSVVGIDDSKYSKICDVPLTTVRHPHQLLGEMAAKMLIEQMNAPAEHQNDCIFVPELVIRDSVKIIRPAERAAEDAEPDGVSA
ncbi:MAG: GntR family transcriptional regulator [Oscillospiraceae bacterium]|nr:GntR family transcriptional regulator [Oscillospiraceae bacterium]